MRRIDWQGALPEIRATLAECGGDRIQAAAVLTDRWGRRVSYDALTAALRRWPEEIARGVSPRPAPVAPPLPDLPPLPVATAAAQQPAQLPPVPSDGLIAIIADVHAPDHDEAALSCFERWAAIAHPSEIIVAGDLAELESASEHPGSAPVAHEDDLEAVRGVLRRLLRLAPRVTYRAGNHETRPLRLLGHRAPALGGVYSLPELLGLATMGVEWVPESQSGIRRGSIRIWHGHEWLRSKYPPAYHARAALDRYAEPGTSIVYGHVHRRQHLTRPMEGGYCEALSIPCLRSLDPRWLGPEVSGWSHGFAVATLRPGCRTALEVVEIHQGRCVWGGRVV